MIVAITGYIGTGKSTAAQFMKEEGGFEVITVDSVAHELLKQAQVRERLRAEFGLKVLDRNLEINREKLAELVFSDTDKLSMLNRIVHPHLKEALHSMIRSSSQDIVVDVALFNELNLSNLVQKVILVNSDVVNIYDRLKPRYSKEQVLNIMNSQTTVKSPDFMIENNGTKEDLRKKVKQVLEKLR